MTMTVVPTLRSSRKCGRAAAASFPLLLLVACSTANADADAAPPDSNLAAGVSSDTLRLWLEVPREARAGEPVPMVLMVENVSERPVDLYLHGRPIAFDLTVADAEGETVWRRLHDAVIPVILRIETLAPGDTLTLEDTWDQRSIEGKPAAAGAYTVRGELLTEDEPLTAAEVPLRITPG